jgi:hypothetical protein
MADAEVSEDEIESRVRVRLGRQRVLDSVELEVLLGEAALHQQVGGRDVLIAQLRHLVEIAGHDNVDLRVVPFTAGWVPALEGGWAVIESAEERPVVHTENRKSGWLLHEDVDVRLYMDAIASMRKKAMSPQATVGLIAEEIQKLEMI